MDLRQKEEKARVFVEHIARHLDETGKGEKDVVCKICGKTIDEIWDEETKNDQYLFIQPGLYKKNEIYIDRNGMPFYVKSGMRKVEEKLKRTKKRK